MEELVQTNRIFKDRSIDLQKVANRLGYEVVTTITEKISGAKTNEERKGIQQLLEGARNGLFKKVMVTEVSRLGRSTIETLKLIEELHKLGISIYLQDLNAETLNEKGEVSFQTEIMLHMLSLFSKNERRNLIDRILQRNEDGKKLITFIVAQDQNGTVEVNKDFLSKYPKIVEGLKKGFQCQENA